MRARSRWTSSSLPCDWNCASRTWSSASIEAIALRHRLVAGDVVRRGVDGDVLDGRPHVAGQRVEQRDPLERVAEEREPDRLLLVAREELDGVAAHAERVPRRSVMSLRV